MNRRADMAHLLLPGEYATRLDTDKRNCAQWLTQRLAAPLPGRPAQRRGAPALAYGRHGGPAPRDARHAAVALVLFRRQGQWRLPLTRRAVHLRHHGGQVSLPGGQLEAGESAATGALREYYEELGIQPRGVHLCGQLTPLYVFASNNFVRPVVAVADPPAESWAPDPQEVDCVLELPLSALTRPDRWRAETRQRLVRQGDRLVGTLDYRAPALDIGPYSIWGATSMILAEFSALLPR